MTLSLKKRPKLLVGDYTVWAIFFTLCFISVIEVYSAGSYLTIKENSYFSPLFKQICYLGLAAITASVVQFIHFRYLSYLPSAAVSFRYSFSFSRSSEGRTLTTVPAGSASGASASNPRN